MLSLQVINELAHTAHCTVACKKLGENEDISGRWRRFVKGFAIIVSTLEPLVQKSTLKITH